MGKGAHGTLDFSRKDGGIEGGRVKGKGDPGRGLQQAKDLL
jgi:hypothetical protein